MFNSSEDSVLLDGLSKPVASASAILLVSEPTMGGSSVEILLVFEPTIGGSSVEILLFFHGKPVLSLLGC